MTDRVRKLAARMLLAVLLLWVVATAGVMEVRRPVVLILLGVIVAAFFLARLSVARRGYRVDAHREDRIVYEESNGWFGLRRMVFDGDTGPRHRLIYVPKPATWDAETPVWAHGRRSEILRRLQEACGPGLLAFVDEE
jgi:hypothetical protein